MKRVHGNNEPIEVPNTLLEHIYEAASEGDGWTRALCGIADWIGASGAMYCLLGTGAIAPGVKAIHSSGFAAAANRSYAEDGYLIDPHMRLGVQTPVANWFFSQDHFDHGFIARDPFFQEVMNPLGIRWVAGSRIWSADGADACVAFQKAVDAPCFADVDRARLAAVTPHLYRATRVHERLTKRAFESGLGAEAMHHLAVGVAIVDSRMCVLYSNAVGDRLIARRSIFRCLPGGRISLACTSHRHVFGQAVAAAMNVRSTPLCIVDRNGCPAVNCMIVPMPPAAQWNALWQRPLAMLVMSEIPRAHVVPPGVLHQLFSLTPAESGLANWLLTGRSLNEYADERSVSIETARTQLKAILSKTGMGRQGELVAHLARLSAFGSEKPQA